MSGTRRTPAGLAALLVLAAGLAGCLGGDTSPTNVTEADPASTNASSSTNASLPIATNATIEGCTGYSVQAPLPWDAVADALPEGFEPEPFVPIVLGPVTSTEDRAAEGFFDGWRCQEATVGNASLGETTILLPKVHVRAPAELAPPDGHDSYVPLFLATDAPRLAEAFSDWGLAAEVGDPTVEGTGAGPARTGHVQGTAANTTLEARVAVGQPPVVSSASREHTRYFLTQPALFHDEAPEVVGVLDRATRNATIGAGDGSVRLAGEAAGQALGPARPGLGFDTQDQRWGETFVYKPLEAIR